MNLFFLYLYPLVGIIALLGFIPQLKSLIYAVATPDALSLSSWFLWAISSIISFGYGAFVLSDLMFCFVTGVSVILNVSIIYLIIHRRYVMFGTCRNVLEVGIKFFCRAPRFGFFPAKLKREG